MQFFIGLEYEKHQNSDIGSIRNLFLIQLLLTAGVAGIRFIEGTVRPKIAIIKGNKLYESAIKRMVDQSLTWFAGQFSVRLADKFNHVILFIFRTMKNFLLSGSTSYLSTKT